MPQSVDVSSVQGEGDPVGQARRDLEAGRLEQAERRYEALLESDRAADTHKGIADVALRRGSLDQAIESYRRALALRPDWPEAENNLGSAHKLRGDQALAEQHYRRALSLNPELHAASNNLGVMLAEKGELAEAAARFERAAADASTVREARRNLATALYQLGDVDKARAEFERALAADPQDPHTLVGVARLRRTTGQPAQALDLAKQALRLRPGLGEAYLEAGEAALALGNPAQAQPYCRHAVEALPGNADAHRALASALHALGFVQDARNHIQRALALAPKAPSVLLGLGRVTEDLGMLAEAEQCYRAALQAEPSNTLAMTCLGNIALKHHRPSDALAQFENVLKLKPEAAAAYNNVASALNELRRHEEAAEMCRKGLALNPDLADLHHNLGAILQILGKLEESRRCYERAVQLNPKLVPAIFSLSNLAPETGASAHQLIDSLLAEDRIGEEAKMQLHFARVRLHEKTGDYASAFAAAEAGNAVATRREAYDRAMFEQLTADIKKTFTAEFFETRRSYGAAAEQPIFVVGMPRSGTTLVEQVLASHPQVFGAGELLILPQLAAGLKRWSRATHDFPAGVAELNEPEVLRLAGAYRRQTRALAGSSTLRVTDKMPSNLFYLGLAALLFPGAKIVWCRRDPFDLFISGYFMLFRNPLPFTWDQESFAHFYRLQEELYAYWRAVLPLQIHEFKYESFVADQEGGTRALLQYCGLEWDPQCLNFHLTQRPIRTGSDIQVRQPLYRTSVGRAQPYREHLQRLAAALAAPPAGP